MSSSVSSRELTADASSPRLLGYPHKPASALVSVCLRQFHVPVPWAKAGIIPRLLSCPHLLYLVHWQILSLLFSRGAHSLTAVTTPAPPPLSSYLQLTPPLVPTQRRSQRRLCCQGQLRRSCGFPFSGLTASPPSRHLALPLMWATRPHHSLCLLKSCLLLFPIAQSKASEPPTRIPHIPASLVKDSSHFSAPHILYLRAFLLSDSLTRKYI